MKNTIKNLLLILTIVTLVFSLASCFRDKDNGDTTTPEQEEENNTPQPEAPVDYRAEYCEKFNGFVANNRYATVDLSITTVTGSQSLVSTFSLNNDSTVDYAIEKLSTIKVNEDGTITFPESYKEIFLGTATISADKSLVELDGEFVDLGNDYSLLDGSFCFESDNLDNFKVNDDGSVSFNIRNADQFLGCNNELKNMTVNISYNDYGFTAITINCNSASSTINYKYTFGEVVK